MRACSLPWCHKDGTREYHWPLRAAGEYMGNGDVVYVVFCDEHFAILRHGERGLASVMAPELPHLGADVMYRSRTGDYWLAAKVSRTYLSSSPEALERAKGAGRLFMVDLKPDEVDLTVFTPGGSYVEGEPSQWTGNYAEHTVPHDPQGAPRSWCWMAEALARGVDV